MSCGFSLDMYLAVWLLLLDLALSGDYRWSSANPHLKGVDDELVTVAPLLELISDWEDFLRLSTDEELKVLQLH